MDRKKCVLVIEDNDDVRETVVEILNLEGHEVHSAVNGLEALGKLDSIPVPDLIILDLMMPVMDGPSFYSHLKKSSSHSEVPVVLFSAVNDLISIEGVSAQIRKPANLEEILEAVKIYGKK